MTQRKKSICGSKLNFLAGSTLDRKKFQCFSQCFYVCVLFVSVSSSTYSCNILLNGDLGLLCEEVYRQCSYEKMSVAIITSGVRPVCYYSLGRRMPS